MKTARCYPLMQKTFSRWHAERKKMDRRHETVVLTYENERMCTYATAKISLKAVRFADATPETASSSCYARSAEPCPCPQTMKTYAVCPYL